jgi:hypothetical protein
MANLATIISLIVAGYGAILATINSIIQLISHRRDRADVVLRIRWNMKTNVPRYAGMTLTLVTATNKGKRPVTIEGFSTKVLDSRTEYMLADIRPPLPCELSESRSVTAFVNQGKKDRAQIESYYVWDSVGRNFRINIVPWYRRLLSRFRRRFAPADRLKDKA